VGRTIKRITEKPYDRISTKLSWWQADVMDDQQIDSAICWPGTLIRGLDEVRAD
jgi:hypothetical protein